MGDVRAVGRPGSHKTVWIAPFLGIFLGLLPADVWAQDEQTVIRIGGTGGALGGMKELAAAYSRARPAVKIVFFPSLGSSGGIKAVLEGSLDIGVSARPLKEEEIRKGATAVAYAKTPLVFVTSHRAEKTDYSLQELAAIYNGTLKTWSDGSAIRIVMRPESESTTQDMMKISPEMAKAVRFAMTQKGMITAITDQDNLDTIENVPGAIGVATLSQVVSEKRSVQVLSVDGVVPTVETPADGAYVHQKTFYLVTTATPSARATSFIAFVQSPEAASIFAQTGQRMERAAP